MPNDALRGSILLLLWEAETEAPALQPHSKEPPPTHPPTLEPTHSSKGFGMLWGLPMSLASDCVSEPYVERTRP